MKRKFLSVLIAMLVILISTLLLLQNNYANNVQKAQNEYNLNNNFYPFNVPFTQKDKLSYKDKIAALNYTANKTNLSYLKRIRYNGWKNKDGQIDYNHEEQKVQFQISNNRPSLVFKNFNMAPKILAKRTNNLNNTISGYSISIAPINDSIKKPLLQEGNFFLETNNPKKTSYFFKTLAAYISKKFHIHCRLNNFKTDNIVLIDFDDPDKLLQLEQIAIAFLFIFLIIFQISNSRLFSLYKLNGFSLLKSFQLSSGKMFITTLLLIMILDLLYYYNLATNISPAIIIEQLGILLSIPLISFTVIEILQSFSFNNQINNKNYNKLSFLMLYTIKGGAMVLCFFALLPLVEVGTGVYTNIKDNNYNSNIAVFYPIADGNNDPGDSLNKYAYNLDKNMYKPLNQKGALIIEDSIFQQIGKISEGTKYITINPNYLKRYPLYDLHHKKIGFSDYNKNILLCVPNNRKKYNKELINYIKENAKLGIHRIPKITIIYTSPQQNHKFIDVNNGKSIYNQTLFVSTYSNSSFSERNIMDGQGENDGLKIPIKKSLKQTYQLVKPILIKNNYLDNYPQLVKQSDIPMIDLKISIGNVLDQALIICTSLSILFILIMYVALLFFKVYKRAITIKRMNGFSLFLSYYKLWGLLCFQYIFMFIFMIFKNIANLNYLLILIAMLIVEIVINILVINRLEHKKIGENINEQ